MPNWVTNKIKAPSRVIAAMLNAEGRIDFNAIAPFPGPRDEWDSICYAAQEAAEIVCRIPLNEHPLISALEASNRARFDIRKLSESSFSQFVGMLENFRACGYLHSMDFARKAWGTKWNACEPQSDVEAGVAEFQTAWACPDKVLIELSKRFPDDEISVTFADEDIGSNCGTFTLKAGHMTDRDLAPAWRDMTDEQKAKWKAFACEVTGYTPEDEGEEAATGT